MTHQQILMTEQAFPFTNCDGWKVDFHLSNIYYHIVEREIKGKRRNFFHV